MIQLSSVDNSESLNYVQMMAQALKQLGEPEGSELKAICQQINVIHPHVNFGKAKPWSNMRKAMNKGMRMGYWERIRPKTAKNSLMIRYKLLKDPPRTPSPKKNKKKNCGIVNAEERFQVVVPSGRMPVVPSSSFAAVSAVVKPEPIDEEDMPLITKKKSKPSTVVGAVSDEFYNNINSEQQGTHFLSEIETAPAPDPAVQVKLEVDEACPPSSDEFYQPLSIYGPHPRAPSSPVVTPPLPSSAFRLFKKKRMAEMVKEADVAKEFGVGVKDILKVISAEWKSMTAVRCFSFYMHSIVVAPQGIHKFQFF